MRPEVDTHTHTVLSGHAHSTLIENATVAAKIGLKGFVMSDHGPCIHSAPPDFNIGTYAYLPDEIEGVRIYRGIEANIIDFTGGIDIRETYLKRLEYVIAGMHEVIIVPDKMEKNTDAVIGALNNPYVDIIAHPDNPSYPLDYETVVKETARLDKLLEVNDHSFEYRKGSEVNAVIFLGLCKKYDVRVAVSSDAHFAYSVGQHENAMKILKQNDFPEELVINLTKDRFDGFIKERIKRIR